MQQLTITTSQAFDKTLYSLVMLLSELVPFKVWMITRVVGNEWKVISSSDSQFSSNIESVPWEDTFCFRMASGAAPKIAFDAQAVKLYDLAGINSQAQIGAYIGFRLQSRQGKLIGTLCGMDPHSHLKLSSESLRRLESVVQTINTLLELELQ